MNGNFDNRDKCMLWMFLTLILANVETGSWSAFWYVVSLAWGVMYFAWTWMAWRTRS